MATQQISRETFLERLRASGLLSEEQLARAAELATKDDRGKTVARALIEQGLLTRFQAEMVYRGRTDGFTLGQYRILDRIGRGGMGRVFKAEHQTMDRVVALKVLAPDLMKTERARKLFEREVRAAAKLDHPNIVRAFDANQIGERHYLVMEFVDGPNLHELVKERGRLPVGQSCDFIRQAALGLQFAHELGMVHRDIKPANLLVHRGPGQHCVVKVLDFGLARLHEPPPDADVDQDSLPAVEQQVMGTPDYLSPEQSRNLHKVDIRSDLYSLGCTFYYLLTGQVPFPGGSTMEKLVRHTTEDATPAEQLRPEIPAAVAALVRRLMAKDPQERFQTSGDLAAALVPFAVACPASWDCPTSGIDLGDSPAITQLGSDDATLRPTDSDAGSALVGTLPNELTLTPMSITELPSLLIRRAIDRDQRRRLKIAVGVGCALVGGVSGPARWYIVRECLPGGGRHGRA